jgi:hypothetical protein
LGLDNAWYCRVLLLFKIKSQKDSGLKEFECAYVSVLEQYTGRRAPGMNILAYFGVFLNILEDLYQFRYRRFHFRYRLSESYHFRYRFLPLSLQGPIVTGIRTMERSYLCTYTMNVPTLRTFTRACSLLKTFSSSKLPSEALQFLPTIVTGNRYRDTYCYRKSLQDIVTETHIVTGNRYRKSLQRHIVTGNRYRKSLQRQISLQEIVTETHIVTGIF